MKKGYIMENNKHSIDEINIKLTDIKSKIENVLLNLKSCIANLKKLRKNAVNYTEYLEHSKSLELNWKKHKFDLKSINEKIKELNYNTKNKISFDPVALFDNFDITESVVNTINSITSAYCFINEEIKAAPIFYYPILNAYIDSAGQYYVQCRDVINIIDLYIDAGQKVTEVNEKFKDKLTIRFDSCEKKYRKKELLNKTDVDQLILTSQKNEDREKTFFSVQTKLQYDKTIFSDNCSFIDFYLNNLKRTKKDINKKLYMPYQEFIDIIEICYALEKSIRICLLLHDSELGKKITPLFILPQRSKLN